MEYPGNDVKQWFVMRDLRRSNAKVSAYHLLMQQGLEAFTPMTLQKNARTGKKELVPFMQWLLFVHATKNEIDALIDPDDPKIPLLQYTFQRGKPARYGGVVVDEKSMNYFRIALAKQKLPIIYHYEEITPEMMGRRVHVIRGDMIGYTGRLQRYTGGRNMRLFVELEGYCFAPIQVSPADVQFLDNRKMSDDEERAYYTRLSQMTDIINFLRFAVPQDFPSLSDEQLAEVNDIYSLAARLFDEFRVHEYLCIDEVCRAPREQLSAELQRRSLLPPEPSPDEWPVLAASNSQNLLSRLQLLCQRVRETTGKE